MNNGQGQDNALELYKMEYEKGATRYEDIYKAVWTNFSYLTAVSGAIIAFGGSKFDTEILVFLSSAPLLFWYWATFEPLNRYGDDVVRRLANIEGKLNIDFKTNLSHYTDYAQKTGLIGKEENNRVPANSDGIGEWLKAKWRDRKYECKIVLVLLLLAIVFVILRKTFGIWQVGISQKLSWLFFIICLAFASGLALRVSVNMEKLRVRYIVRFFFFLLHVAVVAFLLIYSWRLSGVPILNQKQEEVKTVTITLKDDKGEVKLTEIELEKLKELLESLRK